MGITINNIPRERSRQTNANPFKSAKPFDANIDYNSLEDGDLFYIEQKEGWTEVNYGEPYLRTMPENIVQSLPGYINKDYFSYEVNANLNQDGNINVDEFFQFDFTPYIKLWIEKPSIFQPTHVSVGVFILPKYQSPYNMEDIPLYLDKDQFTKFSEKLPTVNLGQLHVSYDHQGEVMFFSSDGNLHSCILGNKILEVSGGDYKSFRLINISEEPQHEVRAMVPIHFLAQDNSYDYFSVGNSITVNYYEAYKYEDNSGYYFSIDTECGHINKDKYVQDMGSVHINNFWQNDGSLPHISSIIDELFYYLKNDVKYYHYVRPEKTYIIYHNGVFSSLDNKQYNIVNAKTYLNIIEYFENNPESNMTFTTSELIKLFNIKPVSGPGLIASLKDNSAYNLYTLFDAAFFIRYIDADHVKIELANGYSNSSSSQELQIGEFEE